MKEGRKSFPSGHTSLATAGLGYLAFFLLANVRPTANGGAWRTVVALSPFFLAAWIGISRVRDYWHHWSDVATGAVLGATIAYVVRPAAAFDARRFCSDASENDPQSLQKIAPLRTIAASSQSSEAQAAGPAGGSEENTAPGGALGEP